MTLWMTAALALATSSSGLERVTLTVNGTARTAIVENRGADARPLVIVLHGGMGSGDLMQRTTGFGAVARREGFTVAYPDGTEYTEGQRAWNTGYLLRRQVREADDVVFLDALMDRLVAEGAVDPKRVYLVGGSNGAMMTLVYATQRAERLAGAASVVGAMFAFGTAPARPVPMLFIQGGRDEEVPIEGGWSRNPLVRRAQAEPFQPFEATVAQWMKWNRSEAEATQTQTGSVTRRTFAAGEGGARTSVVVDADGGHGWPGRPNQRGGATIGVNAAEEIWGFFAGE